MREKKRCTPLMFKLFFFCFARINSQLHCLKKRNPSYKAREKNQTRVYVIEINLPAYRNKRS